VRARSSALLPCAQPFNHTAAAICGLLWKIRPQVPFITAGIIGPFFGTLVFAATVEERYAS